MKTPEITPRGEQVLIKPDGEQSRESEYGIVTPGNVEQETKAFGTVVAVGPEVKDIKKDDRVIFGKFAGEEISFQESTEEVDLVLVPQKEVLAFIQE